MNNEVENIEKAEQYLAMIDEIIKDMGEFSYTADEINKELGVEPGLPLY